MPRAKYVRKITDKKAMEVAREEIATQTSIARSIRDLADQVDAFYLTQEKNLTRAERSKVNAVIVDLAEIASNRFIRAMEINEHIAKKNAKLKG